MEKAFETLLIALHDLGKTADGFFLGFTGSFDSSILVDGSGAPILFGPDTTTNYGVTGGVSVVTLMRVNKGSGAGLTMGFVISTGMTAADITIN